jgi:VIT1/CCC1 family predicted Fe2+/Mn2+ transporter
LSHRVLDPLDRTSEVLFGIIMVLTFTGSIRVADAGREDLRAVLAGAIGCNLAWGVVDAAMYLMATLMARARLTMSLKALQRTGSPEAAHRLIVELLPSALSSALTSSDVETLRQRLNQQALSTSSTAVTLTRADFVGAAGVFLLVFLSTFPVVVPLIVVDQLRWALGLSNAVAVLMLFILGWSLGRYAGRPGWRSGLSMVAIGIVLVAITVALGG